MSGLEASQLRMPGVTVEETPVMEASYVQPFSMIFCYIVTDFQHTSAEEAKIKSNRIKY